MKNFTEFLVAVDDLVWGIPLIVLIMGTGIYLTARLGVLQFRKLGKALKYMVKNEEDGIGEVSSFGALCTAMGRHHRYRKYSGSGYGGSRRRSGRFVLDDSSRLPRDGHQVCRRRIGCQVQRG